jgi:hypothetical protein
MLYRPPASIDKHSQFIGASSILKEARELDAAGLRYGAMVRYLESLRRYGLIAGSKLTPEEANRRIRETEQRLKASGVDHTIAQIFIEAADDDPANAAPVAELVLPRYLAAMEPAPKSAPRVQPAVAVTLVRWPYT